MEPEDSDKTNAAGTDTRPGSAPRRGCLRAFVWGVAILALILVSTGFWLHSHYGTLDIDEIVRLKVIQTLDDAKQLSVRIHYSLFPQKPKQELADFKR